MAPETRPPERPNAADHRPALDAERRAQIRALLLLALGLLLFLLFRARPLQLFHPGWWRL